MHSCKQNLAIGVLEQTQIEIINCSWKGETKACKMVSAEYIVKLKWKAGRNSQSNSLHSRLTWKNPNAYSTHSQLLYNWNVHHIKISVVHEQLDLQIQILKWALRYKFQKQTLEKFKIQILRFLNLLICYNHFTYSLELNADYKVQVARNQYGCRMGVI